MNTEIAVSGGTPNGAGTITLFDSFVAFKGTPLAALDIKRIHFAVDNDQAGSLRARKSEDGTNWQQIVADIAKAASAADAITSQEFVVDSYRYFQLQWVNGGVTQTVWLPSLVASDERAAAT